MDTNAKINFATEIAFTALVTAAKTLGLEVNPVMGLMYMPTQESARKWQEAARIILAELGVTCG